MTTRPIVRSISPQASPEEVAAIVGAIAELTRAQAAPAAPATTGLHEWVRTARLGARRAGLQRGPWRLSGRIGRRTRAQ
jgi:hypothetical protein